MPTHTQKQKYIIELLRLLIYGDAAGIAGGMLRVRFWPLTFQGWIRVLFDMLLELYIVCFNYLVKQLRIYIRTHSRRLEIESFLSYWQLWHIHFKFHLKFHEYLFRKSFILNVIIAAKQMLFYHNHTETKYTLNISLCSRNGMNGHKST